MNSNLETVILGKKVRLSPRQKAGLKGFTIGEKIAYRFFDGEYQGVSLLFVKPKGDNPTPRECDITRSEERRVGKECRSRWSPYH